MILYKATKHTKPTAYQWFSARNAAIKWLAGCDHAVDVVVVAFEPLPARQIFAKLMNGSPLKIKHDPIIVYLRTPEGSVEIDLSPTYVVSMPKELPRTRVYYPKGSDA